MGGTELRILVVDSDGEQAEKIERELTCAGYAVICKADSMDGLVVVEKDAPALIVLNWAMPFISGALFTDAVRRGTPNPPPVVAIAGPDIDPASVRRAGASAWLPAPPDMETLIEMVRTFLNRP